MKRLFFVLPLILFISCGTTKGFKGRADFCGMLTDSNNNGITGYTVCINGSKKAVTNDSGIFVIPDVASQKIHVTGFKNGYEKIDQEAYFFNENNFVCFTVRNKEEVINEIERCLYENEIFEAQKLVDSIDYKENDDKVIFLQSLIFYLKHENKKAEKKILKMSSCDENIEKYKQILNSKFK